MDSSHSRIKKNPSHGPTMLSPGGAVQRPLPWRSRIGFISGHVFNDLCASMWFSYLVLYFNYVLEFSHSMSG